MCNMKRKHSSAGTTPSPTPIPSEFAPNYGVLINDDDMSVSEKADAAVALGASHARMAIRIDQWNSDPSSNAYEAYDGADLDVVMNVNRSSSPSLFVANSGQMATYLTDLGEILDAYPPALLVVENEEFNRNYHGESPISDYCEQLKQAAILAHTKNVKVTNGGINGMGLKILVYRWLVSKGRQADADTFGTNCMVARAIKSAQNPVKYPNYNDHVADVVLVLNTIRDYCDYCNIHMYEIYNETMTASQRASQTTATKDVVKNIVDYVYDYTGKYCVTNELGIRGNTKPALVTSILQNYKDFFFDFITFFSGGSVNAEAEQLVDGSGNLNSLGDAYKAFVEA